jgi:hypothetical protein
MIGAALAIIALALAFWPDAHKPSGESTSNDRPILQNSKKRLL